MVLTAVTLGNCLGSVAGTIGAGAVVDTTGGTLVVYGGGSRTAIRIYR